MDYTQYQQQHGQRLPQHISGPYVNAPQGASVAASMTSPRQQSQSHPSQSQTSPIMNPQPHTYAHQGPTPQTGYAVHHQMGYVPPPQQYAMPSNMHPGPYGIATSQAAASAMAAASGQGYYPLTDPGLGGSPRGVGAPVKAETRGPLPGSPRQGQGHVHMQQSMPSQNQMALGQQIPPQRHMNHSIHDPSMQPQQHMMAPPPTRTSVPPQMQTQTAPQQQQQQSPEVVAAATGAAEESPLYVNAKQFHRILKRRVARAKLEEQLRISSKSRKPYLHESRHNHAMRRPRGPGGRFLTADEVAALDKKAAEEGGDGEAHLSDEAMAQPPAPPRGAGVKRRAFALSGEAAKKVKLQKAKTPSPTEDEEDEEDEEEGDGDDV